MISKIFSLTIILLFLLILPLSNIQARSGCCSHHGGVCGCGCCDGTNLSATCAPYYPTCNNQADNQKSDNSWLGWVIGLGIIGGIVYLNRKKKK